MTIVRASFVDGVRVPLGSGTITYTPTRPLPSTEDASKTVMPVHAQASVTAGVVQEKDLNPGPYDAKIDINGNAWFTETYKIIVPETGPVNLMDLVEETTEYQPPVVGAVTALRNEVVAAVAAVEGLSTAQDAAVADLVAPGTATKAALDGTYAPSSLSTTKADASSLTAIAPAGGVRAVGKGELIFNVRDYGAVGNGITDDGPAIEAAIAAINAVPNAYSAAGVLLFPPGKFMDSKNHVIPSNKRIHIRGSQIYTSIVTRTGAASGDWWTLNSNSGGMETITLEGGRYQGATGDAVVLNGAYGYLTDVQIVKSGGSGLVVGKAAPAIAPRITHVSISECAQYGAQIVAGSGSTDGMWVNVVISATGWTGFKIEESAQNILNLHVWGCGVESTTDYHGVWITATGCLFATWQSEKNLGSGIYIQGNNNQFVGGRAWGNGLSGIRSLASNRNNYVGNEIYWNGVKNTTLTSTISFSGIHMDNSQENVLTGNNVWDSAVEIPAGNYVTVPTHPYPGRTATQTQPYNYAEAGTSDFNVLVGNSMRKERARSGAYNTTDGATFGNSNIWSGNDLGSAPVPTKSVAGGAVRIAAESDTAIVSASQEITSILGHRAGRVVRLIFTNASPQPVRDNGTTLNLNGDFAPTQNDVLSLVSDGTNWYEVSRSAN